jgi:TetR/AcrR family transcriptional regulator, cholesterol catabolism regulator
MASAPPRAKRDRHGDILRQAAKLFLENGYHATSMDDVAEAVTLNKGTLYYYYESKSSLLFELLMQTAEQRLKIMRNDTSNDPREQIRHFVEDTIAYLAQHSVQARVSMQEAPFLDKWLSRDQARMVRARHLEFEEYAADAVARGQADGLFDPALDSRVVANNLSAMLTAFVRWYRPAGRLAADEVAAQTATLILRGLLSAGARHATDVDPSS